MRHLKPFEDFIKEGVVKRISINSERAKSLISESERKMRSIKMQLEKIGVIEDNANDYVELEGDKGSILLPYHSKAVNIVAGSEFGSSVIVYIDEKPINDSDKGFDLGKPITDEKLYNLVRSKDSGNHLIEINVTGKGFRIYTFTFG